VGALDFMRRARSDGQAITAAAQRIDLLADRTEAATRRTAGPQAWQADAWVYRDAVGEVRYAIDWLGNIMSRLIVILGVVSDPTQPPIPLADALDTDREGGALVKDLSPQLVADATDALLALAGGAVGHGHLLAPLTVNLEVPGECYLLGRMTDAGEEWSVRSIDELERKSDGIYLKGGPTTGQGEKLDLETTYVARLWHPHPRWGQLPDSPMRGILDPCETLLLLSRKERIRTRQRLSNGVLLVPDELDFEPEPGQQRTSFGARLTQLMVSAVADESAASSLAPAVIRGQGDLLEKMKKLDLVDKDDAERDERKMDRALQRIGRGLDVPPEVIEGLKDVKFANAVAIDSTGFRYHIEPKAQAMFAMLTEGYLWERLEALGHEPTELRRLVLWYDPVEVVTNPNRLPDAKDLHGAYVISDEALRDAGGFSDDDAPSDEELLRRTGLHQRTLGPQLDYALLMLLAKEAGIDLGPPPAPAGGGGGGAAGPGGGGSETSSPAALPSGEGQQPEGVAASAGRREAPWVSRSLALDLDLRARVEAAADAAMRRAMERAGARVVSKVKRGSALAASVAGVPTIAVCAAAGEQGVAQLGMDPDQLLAGAFTDLAETFRVWTTATWEQGLQLSCELLGLTYAPPDALTAADVPPVVFSDADTAPLSGIDQVALRNRFAIDVAQAAEGLADDLYAEARDRLFNPTFVAPEFGEHDPALAVSPGSVRKALAVAGGANSSPFSSGVDDRGVPVNPADGDAGYVATGRSFTESMMRAGVPIYAYRWVWGGSPRPFPDHKALDGQTFADQSHPALSVPDGYANWLPATSFFPGDHKGCRCSTERLCDDPFSLMEPDEARRVRAAQKARNARGVFVKSAAGIVSPDRPA
jgi:hypothetical protein